MPLDDGLDDQRLAVEVAIDEPGADAGGLRNVRHAGGMKAALDEALLGRIQDALALARARAWPPCAGVAAATVRVLRLLIGRTSRGCVPASRRRAPCTGSRDCSAARAGSRSNPAARRSSCAAHRAPSGSCRCRPYSAAATGHRRAAMAATSDSCAWRWRSRVGVSASASATSRKLGLNRLLVLRHCDVAVGARDRQIADQLAALKQRQRGLRHKGPGCRCRT